jgi:hypothetical protein
MQTIYLFVSEESFNECLAPPEQETETTDNKPYSFFERISSWSGVDIDKVLYFIPQNSQLTDFDSAVRLANDAILALNAHESSVQNQLNQHKNAPEE